MTERRCRLWTQKSVQFRSPKSAQILGVFTVFSVGDFLWVLKGILGVFGAQKWCAFDREKMDHLGVIFERFVDAFSSKIRTLDRAIYDRSTVATATNRPVVARPAGCTNGG